MKWLSDTNAYVWRKPLKIASETDSRTQTGQSWCKAEWKKKTKQPCSWVCKVNSVSSEHECVLVDAHMHGFPLAVLHCNQAERKSLSTCRQHICRGLKIHPASHMVQTPIHPSLSDTCMLALSFNYYQCFGVFFQEEMTENHRWPSKQDKSAALFTFAQIDTMVLTEGLFLPAAKQTPFWDKRVENCVREDKLEKCRRRLLGRGEINVRKTK